MQERHRVGLRHGGRGWDGRELGGGDHHAGFGRDHAVGIALGAKPATLAGLAGVGDLVATCTSPHSRNRTFGQRLGTGESLEAAKLAAGGHIAEGVTSCESVLALADSYDVEMPLTDAVHRVCHRGLSVPEAVTLLLGRTTKPE